MNMQQATPLFFTEPQTSIDIPLLSLTNYCFTFKVRDHIDSFTFSGSLWHGLWGKALRQRSCTIPDTDCKNCLLLHQCHYSFLFRGTHPPQAKRMRAYTHIPVPHVFQQTEQDVTLQAGDLFSVNMVFVNDSQPYLPLILQTLYDIGQMGFGKKRYQADLYRVTQQLDQGKTHLILDQHHYYPPEPTPAPVYPPCPEIVRIQFVSPCQLSTQEPYSHQFVLSYFLMGLIRRISHLQYFYTDESLEVDFPYLKQQTQQAEQQIINQCLTHKNRQRYSAKHQRRINISGFMGYIDLSLKHIEALWPYLYLGQKLNTGKNASMGYGQYELLQRY